MKLSLVFEPDDDGYEVLKDKVNDKVVARRILAVAKTNDQGKVILEREGNESDTKTFDGTEQEILNQHLPELLEFLGSPNN